MQRVIEFYNIIKEKSTRTSGSLKVSNWDILEIRSQKSEIRPLVSNQFKYKGTLNQKKTEL